MKNPELPEFQISILSNASCWLFLHNYPLNPLRIFIHLTEHLLCDRHCVKFKDTWINKTVPLSKRLSILSFTIHSFTIYVMSTYYVTGTFDRKDKNVT